MVRFIGDPLNEIMGIELFGQSHDPFNCSLCQPILNSPGSPSFDPSEPVETMLYCENCKRLKLAGRILVIDGQPLQHVCPIVNGDCPRCGKHFTLHNGQSIRCNCGALNYWDPFQRILSFFIRTDNRRIL
jgi:hypothetical protein